MIPVENESQQLTKFRILVAMPKITRTNLNFDSSEKNVLIASKQKVFKVIKGP